MLNEQTIATLNTLKLFGMARAFEERLNNTNHAELSHAEFVGLLVQDEKIYRDNQRLKRLLKNAKLRQQAALEDVDYRHPRGLNKQVMLELSSSPWIDTHRNVLITGPLVSGNHTWPVLWATSRLGLAIRCFMCGLHDSSRPFNKPGGMARTSKPSPD